MRAISAIAGSIVIAGALGVAVAQSAATVESVKPQPKPGLQEMTAGQMLNYMKEQGTKYIVETTDIPKDKKFEVNLGTGNADETAKAIAKALDLKAVKEGNVWVFKNQDFTSSFNFDHDFDHNMDFDFDFEMPDMPFVDGHAFMFDGEMFKGFEDLKGLDGKEWDQMTPEEKAKFEKTMKEFQEKLNDKLGKMKIELKNMDGKIFKFDDEMFKNFKGKDWEKMTPEEKAKFEKEMAEMKKSLKNMKVEINGMNSEEFKRDMERMQNDLKNEIKEGVRIKIENTDKLIASITDKQWELMKSQGHLKLSDLTQTQRELIGNPKGDGEFNITIERDGKKLIIRK